MFLRRPVAGWVLQPLRDASEGEGGEDASECQGEPQQDGLLRADGAPGPQPVHVRADLQTQVRA